MNDEFWSSFIVIVVQDTIVSTPHPMFIPTHLTETQDGNGSTTGQGCNDNMVSSPPPHTDLSNKEFRCHITNSNVVTKRWWTMFFVVLYFRHHCKYPPTFVPTHVADNNTCWSIQRWQNNNVGWQWCNGDMVSSPPPTLISLTQVAGATLLTATWQPNDDELSLFAVVFYYTVVSTPFIPTPSLPCHPDGDNACCHHCPH